MPKQQKPTKRGNCYDVHARALVDGTETGLLCHGTVWHPDVGYHGHCWIERDESLPAPHGRSITVTMCRDISQGKDIVLPCDLYYYAGKVKDVRRYTTEEAAVQMLKHKHFGPWHRTEDNGPWRDEKRRRR